MPRHIAWFIEAPVEPRPEGGLISDDHTVCRRCLVPARALETLGLECSVFGNLEDADPMQVALHLQKLHADVVIIGKFSASSPLPMARAAKHIGCYVILDVDPEDIGSPDLAPLTEIVDQVIASGPAVAAEILEATGVVATIIPACDENDKGERSPLAIAKLWMESFKKLKLKPPSCANTNEPTKH